MKMIRLFFFLGLCFVVTIAHGQETTNDPHPLLEMLARVPDMPAVHEAGTVVYADMRAAEAARGLPRLPDSGAWAALGRENQRVWLNAAPNFAMMPDLASNFMMVAEDMPRLLGIDLFAIDRTLYFGQPPTMGYILQGNFDPDAFMGALTQRDYISEAKGAVTIMCPSEGCDTGQEMNLAAREPGNPFGGTFGRQEPLAYEAGYVFNSADGVMLNAIVESANGGQPSLQDNPVYQAAASAIIADGLLRQAMFVEVVGAFGDDPILMALGPSATDEIIAAVRKHYRLDEEDYGPVGRVAELMVIADIADTDSEQQIGRIVLVYDDEMIAQAAATELDKRQAEDIELLAYRGNTLQALIEERGGSLQPVRLAQDETTEKWVLTLDAVAPLVQGSAQDDDGRPRMSGLSARLWVDMVFRRDLLWLA